MRDYAAFIPVVNRFDLLDNAIAAAACVNDELTVIDNSERGITYALPCNLYRGLVPLSFTQTMNLEMLDTLSRDKKFCVHMHSDSIVPAGAIEELLERARNIDAENPKWGVIYTHYDILAIYNPLAMKAIGGYDTNFHSYFSDNDYYHRLDLAGWERINTGIEVGHIGSQTINSDPMLRHINGITFPMYRALYVSKWGGEPDKETYTTPYNFPPKKVQIVR